jgi:DNA-binding MarR family transcriptional regulator
MKILDSSSSAGYMTNHAARLFARAIDARLAGTGAGSGVLPALFALADGAARTQAELARAAAIEQPTMAATLSRMERDGLIERRRDRADKRKTMITLSESGRALLPQLRDATTEINAAALAGLDDAERRQFLAFLGRVCAGLDAHLRGDARPLLPETP